ncbi:MAG: hypothetical protein ACR2KL_11935 [Nocardioidaceae bacterium]
MEIVISVSDHAQAKLLVAELRRSGYGCVLKSGRGFTPGMRIVVRDADHSSEDLRTLVYSVAPSAAFEHA